MKNYLLGLVIVMSFHDSFSQRLIIPPVYNINPLVSQKDSTSTDNYLKVKLKFLRNDETQNVEFVFDNGTMENTVAFQDLTISVIDKTAGVYDKDSVTIERSLRYSIKGIKAPLTVDGIGYLYLKIDDQKKNKITLYLNSESPKTSQQKTPELNFYGAGNIQKSLDNGDKIPASTGLGVNWNYWFPKNPKSKISFDKLELDAMVNVAATVDTLIAKYDANKAVTNSSTFGSSILTPLNSGQAAKISLRMNFCKSLLGHFLIDGIKVKYIGSNRNWQVMDAKSQTKVIQGTNNYLRIGAFQEFLTKDLLDNYSINFGIYYAYNSIKGDIGQGTNDNIRSAILGTKNKIFTGPEAALEIRLKNLRAEFAYSWLGINNEVPGLTGGRLVTTISFVGGFGLKLKD